MFTRVLSVSITKYAQCCGFRTAVPANSRIMKVAILGAAGGTGRCLSLLLKRSSMIDELSLYDVLPTESLAIELNHVNTPCKVNGYCGLQSIGEALTRAKVVVITAGSPYKLRQGGGVGGGRGEMLETNVNVLADLIPHVVRYSPGAMVALVTSPVNILIPLIAEMYKKAGLYDLNNLFGVTTLDSVRSNTFAAELLGLPPESVVVPVIGGNCRKTCIPLFSQMKPSCKLKNEEIARLTSSVKMANEELLKIYNKNGSPCLGMAFAAARFCLSLCKGLRGIPNVVECAYVRSCVVPDVTYFSSPLELGPNGVQRNLGVPPLTDYECKMLDSAVPILREGIGIGEAFVCLNTFPDKVMELNNLIDKHTPEAVKKNRENFNLPTTAPSCLSISSTITRDYYFHDVVSSYSATTWGRGKSPRGICKRKYRPYLRRRSRPLAHIVSALVRKLAACTRAVLIRPPKFIMGIVAAMFLQRDQSKRIRYGSSTLWKTLDSKDDSTVAKILIRTMRPAAVRLIADTTILKRWLQALSLASSSPSPSLSQAIRTTETIDGWAYELFFHLKYLQVINFPYEVGQDNELKAAKGFPESDPTLDDDVMHTNLWHRIVQLRDHYVILFESLRTDSHFFDADVPKSL